MLENMRRVSDLMKLMGPPPASEFKVHPADMDELLLRFTAPQIGDGLYPAFTGVRIVVDPGAPRLPRTKAAP
jgi:hypothetical protein